MSELERVGNKSRVGFVGAGGIAPEHAEALRLVPGVELVAVCDFDEFRARSLAKEFNIPRVYGSLTAMLENEKLDVVHVLTQPQHHVSVAMECLRGGVNVYVEKPMALSTSDCDTLVREAASRGLTVGVNHQFAHFDPIEKVIALTKDRRFGRLNNVIVTYCVSPTGLPVKETGHYMFSTPQALLFEYCPHPFSIIRRLMGKPIAMTSLASEKTAFANGRTFYRSWEISAVAERGTAQLYFSGGRGNAQFTVDVYGQDASAQIDIFRGTMVLHENIQQPITATLRDGLKSSLSLFKQASQNMLNERMVKLKMKPPSIVNRFYPTMSAFYGALRAGRPIGEDASAGRDVIAYCEMAAANMKSVD